jgi:protease-4
MGFFRWIGRILIGALAGIGLLVIAVILLAASAWRDFSNRVEPVPEQALLTLDLGDGVSETNAGDPLALAGLRRGLTMPDLVLGLEAAARDPHVKGLALKLGVGDLPLARAEEIRDALKDFRAQGKFVLAFAESFGEAGNGNTHYLLATGADEIWLQPSGEVGLTGLRIETPFFKDTLDMIGVSVQMDRRKEYKGAIDSLMANAMPSPQRENLQQLVNSMTASLAKGVADRVGGDEAAARALIDQGPFLAADALKDKLVDRLAYRDEFEKELDRRSNGATRYKLVDYAAAMQPPKDATEIALVHGLGPIQLSADGGTLGDVVMDAQSVSEALREAREDSKVKAILFRIDSPGGSYVAADTIWREVARTRDDGKPVIVSMGSVAASGGYFVAAPAAAIVAEPGTITGSIGVFGGKFVLNELWSKLGVTFDGVQSGDNAAIDSANQDYSYAGWNHLEASLNTIYQDFVTKVGTGRKLKPDAVEQVAKGQVWSGSDAAANGLVDKLGGLTTAIAEARRTIGLPPGAPVRLVNFPEEPHDLTSFLEQFAKAAEIRQFAMLAKIGHIAANLERLVRSDSAVQAEMAPLVTGSR